MAEDGEDVLDSWEELEDTEVLDKKLKEMKIEEGRRLGNSNFVVLEDSHRSQYRPQVRILKREPNSSQCENNVGSKGQQPSKTLKQREAEYAQARLRIMGSAYSEDDPDSDERPVKLVQQMEELKQSEENCVNVIREPKGPDGTKGFGVKR
ncbi:hypothetical protein ScPMuIL_008606 [Solemya velum]